MHGMGALTAQVPVLLRLVHQSGGPEVNPLGTALAFAMKRARLPAAADPADVGLVVSACRDRIGKGVWNLFAKPKRIH